MMNAMLLYIYTVILEGEVVDKELAERVILERVELIARLTSEGVCQERDREIALHLIADIASGIELKNAQFSVIFSAQPQKR
ncbi:hypothetical protein SRABI13_00861 [Erwinia aphidicola]|jgi:hypothetical protein|nr:hypothetical protein SRABI13_00861 [Erwinia aphidicola]